MNGFRDNLKAAIAEAAKLLPEPLGGMEWENEFAIDVELRGDPDLADAAHAALRAAVDRIRKRRAEEYEAEATRLVGIARELR